MADIIQYAGPSLAASIVTFVANRTAALADSTSKLYSDSYAKAKQAIESIDTTPSAAAVLRQTREDEARARVGDLAERASTRLSVPLVDLDASIQNFSLNFLQTANQIFPGLADAAQATSARAADVIGASVAANYDQANERRLVDIADAAATRTAFAAAREQMEDAARRGHRFLPGRVQAALAQAFGGSIESASQAAREIHVATVDREYALRLALAKAGLRTHAQVLGGMVDAVTQALRARMAAEAEATNAMTSVLRGRIDASLLRYSQKARVEALIQRAADRFTNGDVAGVKSSDFGIEDWRNANAALNTYYTALANQAATLYNQLRANASMHGSDSDVTDYEEVH